MLIQLELPQSQIPLNELRTEDNAFTLRSNGRFDLRVEDRDMARGDHLYYFLGGGTYSHHGLDCGDGTVIHYELTPLEKLTDKFKSEPSDAKIMRTTMEDFSKGNEVFVREYAAGEHDDSDTVVDRAMNRVGDDGYSVVGNNCEHFVVWCKTGESSSSQVEAHTRAAKAVAQGAPLGLYLLRMSRRVPRPYRNYATVGAVGAAGVVYLWTYMRNRMDQIYSGLS